MKHLLTILIILTILVSIQATPINTTYHKQIIQENTPTYTGTKTTTATITEEKIQETNIVENPGFEEPLDNTWTIETNNYNITRVEGNKYYTPITITNNANQDLTDYQVKIVLNNTWDGWSKATENGTDIYFLDSNNNPLYYYIESWDYANQQAVIWVKVPSIPASSSITIYMYYGSNNPYSDYNDPHKVFLVFDDFSSDPTGNYVYSRYNFYNNFVGMYDISGIVSTLSTGLVLEYDIEPLYYISAQSYGIYNYFGLTAMTSGSDVKNGVYPWSALVTTTYTDSKSNNRYKKYFLDSNGDGEGSYSAPSSQVSVNTWYHVRHIVTNSKQELVIDGYADLTTTEPIDITQFKYIAIWGFTDYVDKLAIYDNGKLRIEAYRNTDGGLHYKAYLDNIKLYKYIDPEPSIAIGSSSSSGSYSTHSGFYSLRITGTNGYAKISQYLNMSGSIYYNTIAGMFSLYLFINNTSSDEVLGIRFYNVTSNGELDKVVYEKTIGLSSMVSGEWVEVGEVFDQYIVAGYLEIEVSGSGCEVYLDDVTVYPVVNITANIQVTVSFSVTANADNVSYTYTTTYTPHANYSSYMFLDYPSGYYLLEITNNGEPASYNIIPGDRYNELVIDLVNNVENSISISFTAVNSLKLNPLPQLYYRYNRDIDLILRLEDPFGNPVSDTIVFEIYKNNTSTVSENLQTNTSGVAEYVYTTPSEDAIIEVYAKYDGDYIGFAYTKFYTTSYKWIIEFEPSTIARKNETITFTITIHRTVDNSNVDGTLHASLNTTSIELTINNGTATTTFAKDLSGEWLLNITSFDDSLGDSNILINESYWLIWCGVVIDVTLYPSKEQYYVNESVDVYVNVHYDTGQVRNDWLITIWYNNAVLKQGTGHNLSAKLLTAMPSNLTITVLEVDNKTTVKPVPLKVISPEQSQLVVNIPGITGGGGGIPRVVIPSLTDNAVFDGVSMAILTTIGLGSLFYIIEHKRYYKYLLLIGITVIMLSVTLMTARAVVPIGYEIQGNITSNATIKYKYDKNPFALIYIVPLMIGAIEIVEYVLILIQQSKRNLYRWGKRTRWG